MIFFLPCLRAHFAPRSRAQGLLKRPAADDPRRTRFRKEHLKPVHSSYCMNNEATYPNCTHRPVWSPLSHTHALFLPTYLTSHVGPNLLLFLPVSTSERRQQQQQQHEQQQQQVGPKPLSPSSAMPMALLRLSRVRRLNSEIHEEQQQFQQQQQQQQQQ